MDRSYIVKAANDNELSRNVVVYMPDVVARNLGTLADIFAGLMNDPLIAANDNQAARAQKGGG